MSYTMHYMEISMEQALAALPSPEVRREYQIPENWPAAYGQPGKRISLEEKNYLVLWREPEMLQRGRPHDLVGVFLRTYGDLGFAVDKGHTVCLNGQSEFAERLRKAGLPDATWWD